MSVQVTKKDDQSEWTVVPCSEYQKLVDAWEMWEDIRAYDEAKANIEVGEEVIPGEVAYALYWMAKIRFELDDRTGFRHNNNWRKRPASAYRICRNLSLESAMGQWMC